MTSVIVPAYKEGHIIQRTVDELARVLDSCVPDYEIIVVDDGSPDDTCKVVTEMAARRPHVHIETYTKNHGKGYALRHGFNASQGQTIVFFDADLDIPADCIPVLLQRLDMADCDGIVGSKMHPESVVDYPWTRRAFSQAAHLFVWSLLQISVKDTQVGLKAFRRPVLERIMHLPHVDGFAFDIELLALAQKAGFKVTEGPVHIEYGHFASTVTPSSIARALMDTLGIFYRIRIKGVTFEEDNRKH